MRPPRVLVAPDSFKGTMSAAVVAEALATGVTAAGGEPVLAPLADGGEGTLEALRPVYGGVLQHCVVTGPLGEPVTATFLLAADGRTAALEAASASGLLLVPEDRRDAVSASTRGTGELIMAAVTAGARDVLVGAGGSGTTDGGAGAIAALRHADLRGVRLMVLCDVRTPFEDAAQVYGPQKGADSAQVALLTDRLHRLAADLPRDPRGQPMTGAAGGLSGGLWAAFDAHLLPGVQAVLDAWGIDRLLDDVDLVLTGEGCLDGQTAEGKVVAGLTARAAAFGVPVWALVGSCALPPHGVPAIGLAGAVEAGTPSALTAAARRLTAGLRR